MARGVVITLIVICLRASMLEKIYRMGCRNEATFKAKSRNMRVKEGSSKIISIINVHLLPNCARSCIKTNGCKSLSFKKNLSTPTEKNCQLLNVERSNLTTSDIENNTRWIYYEPLNQRASRCTSLSCALGQRCFETCNTTTGYSCIDINECDSNPCLNGTCIDQVNAYKCQCKKGFTGSHCETAFDECSPNPCQNGGTCNRLDGSYNCICAPGFNGKQCENEVNECDDRPCPSSQFCFDLINSYKCCNTGYFGAHCEIESISSFTSPNYPSNYNNSYTNTWVLDVNFDKVAVYFEDFSTESCCDYIQLRNGSSASSPLLVKLSGSIPKNRLYIASGNAMNVHFRTDHSITRRGFKAHYGRFR